ncbi:MAG: anhydro-N-acetylmuramic acid kinase [Bacteroidia bacterium]|nr:anhydro-N-acetylmuramic acid kinase [Bacteroidia bacterium]
MNTYHLIGIMSGTSLDGLDIALCRFNFIKSCWKYEILYAETLPYDRQWKEKLSNAHILTGIELIGLHKEYGRYIGNVIKSVIKFKKADAIASHGHTVFHQPGNKLTFQLGDGAEISATTGLPVISDFRSVDVALGGQGAPLVPIGDELLFGDYRYCLNLGGFANISYKVKQKRIAFDICPANVLLNYLANKAGLEYDNDGQHGSKGNINTKLLDSLNAVEYYKALPPKSLGREWFEANIIPLLKCDSEPIEDILRTVYEHIAIQIAKVTNKDSSKNLLVTGGGAFNKFLISRIKALSHHKICLPDDIIINYKEALIFAFLGMLRLRNEINCLRSVTGAKKDNIGGCIYHAKPVS